MKKLMVLVIVAVMALVLSGCGAWLGHNQGDNPTPVPTKVIPHSQG
jgi:uncharacterized protein YceK